MEAFQQAPAVQPPNQHDIDLAPTRGGEEVFTEFALGRAGTKLLNLNRDLPTALRGVLAHGAHLQRQSLLVVRGQKLGAGGMGEVYKARDTRLNRFAAMKVLPASMSADPEHLRLILW
jgi:hypothetical protein